MGSCVSSAHRNSDSAMKFGVSFESKSDNLVIPSSPFKEKPANGEFMINNVGVKSRLSPPRSVASSVYYGSKEETFFDSQPWLDSDCDDDFFSVNGDFTPSRGNTPVHHRFYPGTHRVNAAPFEDRIPGNIPQPSPPEKKKKLAELFLESSRRDIKDVDDQNISNGDLEVKPTILDLPPKSTHSTPYISGTNSVCSSQKTPNRDFIAQKEKPMKSVQCCMPSFISRRSFSEGKKNMIPAVAVNDKT